LLKSRNKHFRLESSFRVFMFHNRG